MKTALGRIAVIGAGDMGVACSLLLGLSHRPTSLIVRDKTSADVLLSDGCFQPLSGGARKKKIQIPPSVKNVVHCESNEKSLVDHLSNVQAILLCVPSSCLPQVADSLRPLLKANSARNVTTPSIVIFSRGLSASGKTPDEVLRHELQVSDKATPPLLLDIVTATGPIIAQEWTSMLSDRAANTSVASPVVPITLGLSSPLQSLNGAPLFDSQLITTAFEDDHSRKLVPLVNSLSLLASVGAGLVSCQYPGSVSAIMSYQHHCLAATTGLIQQFLANPKYQLSPLLVSTLSASCMNFASKEFAFGRKLDFNFRFDDAIKAQFRPDSQIFQSLDNAVEGHHEFLASFAPLLTSPFYTAIADAYVTHLRASTVGKHLVRSGDYSWLQIMSDEVSPLLEQMSLLDEAVATDDAEAYARLKDELASVLGPSGQAKVDLMQASVEGQLSGTPHPV